MAQTRQASSVDRTLSRLSVGVLLVSAAGMPFLPQAGAAGTAKLTVMARLATFFRMHVDHQISALTISESDIRRGYVEVPAATNFSVITNVQSGYIIDFRPRGDVFLSVLVTGLQSVVEIGAQGGSTLHNQPYGRSTFHQLGYRFILRPEVQPGDYAWPLEISVRAA